MTLTMHHIAIIGGGITGLSAAFYLQKAIKEHALPITYTLIEPSSTLGGKIQTLHHEGFVIERGPDCFLKRKKDAVELIKEVGLESELVSNRTGQAYILKKNSLYPIPEDAVMGVPTRIAPFAKSGLFSPVGKVRAAFDLIQPKSKHEGDQSVGRFFRRRLGNEVVDYLIEPLLSGIYASDIDSLSLKATFPNFLQMEQKYGSLVLGMRNLRSPGVADKGQFYTLKRGLSSLVEAVQNELPREALLLNTTVQHLHKTEEGYHLEFENGQSIKADTVLMALPYKASKEILGEEAALHDHRMMAYTTVANVALGFSKDQLSIEQEGTGFVVSRKDEYFLTACTWTDKKWPHTTPEGKVLLRCYVGRPGERDVTAFSDEELTSLVMKDLKRVMKIKGNPAFSVVSRWKEAMPQYKVGHKEWVSEVKKTMERNYPNVYLTGSSYDGAGIGDCIRQGKETIQRVIENSFYNIKV
ncbi:protoporphyrinogen oxidase [Pseudalkalibacillus sp. R45]|uniref:protoporphyrinogen oxidase n=1 Tax=Pseudalkalibacillus sp. R45 TaxID=3457433 RepID=UPI003FCCF686